MIRGSDVLILDEHRHAFCQLKNSGRLFIIKSKANTPSVIDEFVIVGNALLTSFLLIHIVSE